MSKNRIQRQHGYRLLDLFKSDGTEEHGIAVLFKWKWANGFTCYEYDSKNYCPLKSR